MDSVIYYQLFFVHLERRVINMSIQKGLICLFSLLFIGCLIGCGTTRPEFGYIPASKEVKDAYINNEDRLSAEGSGLIPYDGIYLDFGKDGGHTTQRLVWVTDPYGRLLDKKPFINHGEDLTGRLFSNSGAFIGAGTVLASPLWGYLGQKTRRPDRTYVGTSASGGINNAGANAGAIGVGTGGNPTATGSGMAIINPP